MHMAEMESVPVTSRSGPVLPASTGTGTGRQKPGPVPSLAHGQEEISINFEHYPDGLIIMHQID
jgi:hypothetical protein